MPRLQKRSFSQPEETRKFSCGQLRTVKLDDTVFGEYRLDPGWKWSECIKPIVGTPSCQHHHLGYAVEGQLHIEMVDGSKIDFHGGDAYEIPPGHDAWVVGDKPWFAVEFSGASTWALAPEAMGGGVVATLLFTDIVGSTATLAKVGDARWRELLFAHNAAMRTVIDRHRGLELKTTGDGFLAAFDSATRAVRCGQAMISSSRATGLDIRVGCHTGEIEVVQGDAHGMAVHAAARVMSVAAGCEVLVSWTTRDLLAGSAIALESAGEHELKGIEGARALYRVK
jgi:class 3 adenylate cyclase